MGSRYSEPVKFYFKPLGASVVILIPLWRMAVGNLSVGYDVSHSLNSGLYFPGSGENSSTIFSSIGIHDMAKWQF